MTGMRIEIDASKVAAVADAWRYAPDLMAEELVNGVWEASLYLERLVKDNTETASGNLRSSVGAREPRRIGEDVIGVVGTSLGYAIPVELGTKPHFPPVQALSEWARLKFGLPPEEAEEVGYAVARKIAREGTKGHFMFQRAFSDGEATVQAILTRAAERGLQRLGKAIQ
ncbi:hypothetical protein [Dongia deserti]|uniref:hypothetical protein n=1 Tax=Dongia deserti TaxID=2268030 RepID=UPI000E65024E|nr:hypothetical protein [Dongia deserti]